MKHIKTNLNEIFELIPDIYEDDRGYFFESFNENKFFNFLTDVNFNRTIEFVQDNYSSSKFGVIRGLHYQKSPFAQAKLVRVVEGKIFDVVVNINSNSKEFGKYFSTVLSSENKKMLWIPEGYAHGFLALSDNTKVLYKTSKFYEPLSEVTIKWDDPDLNINWPITNKIIIGNKDRKGIKFSQVD